MSEAPQYTLRPAGHEVVDTAVLGTEPILPIPEQRTEAPSTSSGTDFADVTHIAEAPSRRADREFVGYMGERVVMDYWTSKVVGQPVRRHQEQLIHLPGRSHPLLHTDAIAGGDLTVVHLLGWTESIHSQLTKDTHQALSHEIPYASLDTLASYGNDGSLPDRSFRSIRRSDIKRAGKRILEMAYDQYEGRRVILVGTSMGLPVSFALLHQNILEGYPLNVVAVAGDEGAVVTPKEARKKMAFSLLPHLGKSATHELVFRTAKDELAKSLKCLRRSKPNLHDLPVLIRQAQSLMEGTSKEVIDVVTEAYADRIFLTQGERDPLREPYLEARPGVNTKIIPGKGHAMAMNPYKRAHGIGSMVRRSGQYR